MQDFIGIAGYASALLVSFVVVASAIAAAYTGIKIPTAFGSSRTPSKAGPVARIIEVTLVSARFGGGHLLMLLILASPTSSIAIRVVAATELIAATAFIWDLRRRLLRASR
jgi:hypothetical protein